MDLLQALPTLVIVLTLAYMGFLVFHNSHDLTNKLFLTFLLADSSWLISVFLVTHISGDGIEYLGRLTYGIALALTIAIQVFTNELLHIRRSKIYKVFLYGGGAIVILLTILTNLVIEDVKVTEGLSYPEFGSLYPLFVVFLVGAIGAFLVSLIFRWRSLKKTRDVAMKRQLDIVVVGLGTFTFISLSTNLVLPAIFSSPWPSQFAPLGSLVLAASFFYAISRYRLFDIRTAVVRGTTYAFLVATLAVAFALTGNIAGSLITTFKSHPSLQQIFNATLALALAVSFQPLRRQFDRVTNRFFFRDIYDTQEVVDKFNDILISHVNISKMLGLCEELLVDRLKLESCFFEIISHGEKARAFGYQKVPLDHEDYLTLKRGAFALDGKVVAFAGIPSGHKELLDIFREKQLGAIGKMVSHNDNIGLVVFGTKKNGSPLSAQDLGVLGIVADQLAIASQNVLRFEEIQNFNATLQEKIDEATRKLRHTNQRLRILDQTKDDFISMASHQLRTPLTSVKGYVSMVLDGDAGRITEVQRKLLTQSFLSSQRMVYLISDLLNVSRLKTGKFVIEPIESNLANVIQEEVEQLAETVKGRGLELNFHKPEHFPTLLIDETKLRQVIMNFIDNAIYYTPSGGHIDVYLEELPNSIEFRVVDDGIGVPKHEQHHLFTKFFRANNAKRARPDGTGLGIFMAKKVVIAQGGAVIFKSAEGKGSTFGFTFPKVKLLPKPPAQPAQPAAQPVDA